MREIESKLLDEYSYVVNLSGHTSNLYSSKLKKKIFKSHFNGTKNLINFIEKKRLKNLFRLEALRNTEKQKVHLRKLFIAGLTISMVKPSLKRRIMY